MNEVSKYHESHSHDDAYGRAITIANKWAHDNKGIKRSTSFWTDTELVITESLTHKFSFKIVKRPCDECGKTLWETTFRLTEKPNDYERQSG